MCAIEILIDFMKATVLIIGAGLSGLATAFRLEEAGIDYCIVDARNRPGGRIISHAFSKASTAAVDMGPSWFWPGQAAFSELIAHLGLERFIFPQFSQGLSVIEYAGGLIQRETDSASMAGSLRIVGGMQCVVDALISRLDSKRVYLAAKANSIRQKSDGIHTSLSIDVERSADGETGDTQPRNITSEYVVLALPPRVAAEHIQFEPSLPASSIKQLRQTPTWMAAQAKLVVTYSEPFWRAKGLSGDAFSQLGPLTEIHDASSHTGEQAALFGFVGVPPHQRRDAQTEIKRAAIEQLARLFGPEAGKPIDMHYKDWATDTLTCIAEDLQSARAAPVSFELSWWNDKLIWAGSETANRNTHANGYLVGAVESANRVSAYLVGLLTKA